MEKEDARFIFDPMFFDIETTDLAASMGRMLCVGWTYGSSKYDPDCPCDESCECESHIWVPDGTPCSIKGNARCPKGGCDEHIALIARETIEECDFLVGWNSKRFDIPFLNARLMKHGHRPVKGGLHLDAMYLARANTGGIRLRGSSLAHVSSVFEVPHKKTALDFNVWQKAIEKEEDAIDQVVLHNHFDVIVTKEVYGCLKPVIQNLHR